VSDARSRYQRQVGALLESIGARVAEINRLRGRGLRGRALAEHETALALLREQLAVLVQRTPLSG
jgi:hypothetical protein